ncbi:hypothetical protein CC86DRAFT_294548 [Ophiobolus disseminans]|uniref:Zn(2)-C6 fungal-type domain-containing protein n=1 Tax=Ophiobolus disseminans TaxID=1469910 RepID=A0A6A6ZY15_9PLEO|nr:hypothetical protein CC86DRAFT_294548 [Ophiobolus disseminans]
MVRRSSGFVSKKPHRKSRGGCLTCKRKKVKCDETQPACGYCALRRLECEYPQDTLPRSSTASTSASPSHEELHLVPYDSSVDGDFNDITCQIPSWVAPAIFVATGKLSFEEVELLHHYKTQTWQAFAVRGDDTTHPIHQDRVPQLAVTQPYLLSALLSLAASHRNWLQPSKYSEDKALMYRQKTFQHYTKDLQNITSDNYETILLTGTFLLALIPHPGNSASDEDYLEWMYTLLKMSEGLRILASLRWSQGIEKLSIFPLICRELRNLPPPPIIASLQTRAGPLGTTPDHPNPPSTYGMPGAMPGANAVFLPPPLMALLEDIMNPLDTGPIDIHGNTLYPVFHALSPIFLSLYYYHLNPDFNVRVFVLSSFLLPDFLALVKAREPRALVLMAWWFALVCLVPKGWWIRPRVGVVGALGRAIRQLGDTGVWEALEGAERVVDVLLSADIEKAAESVFEGWEGVYWDDGPGRAQEWELGLLVDLSDELDFAGLDLHFDLQA